MAHSMTLSNLINHIFHLLKDESGAKYPTQNPKKISQKLP
jgi:hypothetical protein